MDEKICHTEDDFSSANPVDIKKYNDTELVIAIENALQRGEENALKMWQLKQKLGYYNDRKIRLTIEAMRQSQNHIILSSSKGYWICGSPEEARKWTNYMKSYIKDISHTAKVVEDAAIKEYGEKYYQIPLFFD